MCGTKNGTGGKPGFFSDRRPPSPTKKSRVSFFVPHTAKRHKKVRECSVSIIFVCFVCFVVKKADGLRTPCGKYTAGDSFLEITSDIRSLQTKPRRCASAIPDMLHHVAQLGENKRFAGKLTGFQASRHTENKSFSNHPRCGTG